MPPFVLFGCCLLCPYAHVHYLNYTFRLDASSPLLTKAARKKLTKNGGAWPRNLRTDEGIKKSIDFDNLLISFAGQSKLTCSQVHQQKLYTKENLKIGYDFRSILLKNPDGSLFVSVDDVDLVRKIR